MPASRTVNSSNVQRSLDLSAYGDLFHRHHDAARSLALRLGSGVEAEDVVSEAFERVLVALRRASGPVDSFKP
ncbi:MAG: DNA-directed RNA polymerase specialized sigma24 family protein [Candidatus Poriferisodalaceae bacterium]|jgi:DNA-directed RNA polymerase specialized sigma24 family protein